VESNEGEAMMVSWYQLEVIEYDNVGGSEESCSKIDWCFDNV
jgi:hypothetical protein